MTDHQQEIKLDNLFPQIKQDKEEILGPLDLDHILNTGFNLDDHEKQLIYKAMQRTGNNISEAARLLGISRPALDYRLKKFKFQST